MTYEPRADSRHIDHGHVLPTLSYCDQPYIVQADDGAWVCVVTTGAGHEGAPGQIVTSLRSTDCGKTWEEPVALEPEDGPQASYAVALKTPSGRIYAFYNHNTDEVKELICEDGSTHKRVDSLGHYVFKFSDDHGKSWSEQRYEIPIRLFEIDEKNPYGGDPIRYFWNVGRPIISADGSVYLPHSKVGAIGIGFYSISEGVFLHSSNLLTEQNPEGIQWDTLPEGKVGLRPPPECGRIAEEHTIVELSDGTLYSVYRTISGYPACAYSEDRGRSWTAPRRAPYDPTDPQSRLFKHPRAANFVWKTDDGRYLYWFHNHGGTPLQGLSKTWLGSGAYENRNPAWLSAGHEVVDPASGAKRIIWSEPEIILYDDDPEVRMSYPDFIEKDGQYWITETQKTVARVHPIDASLLGQLMRQHQLSGFVDEASLLLHISEPGDSIEMPELPPFRFPHLGGSHACSDSRLGFTLDFLLDNATPSEATIIDTLQKNGTGLRLSMSADGRLELLMADGKQTCLATSDPLGSGQHHVSIIVDGGPRVVMFVVDGVLHDGGEDRQFGWQRFSPTLVHCNGSTTAKLASRLKELRLYNRALLVSEAVGHARAHGRRK